MSDTLHQLWVHFVFSTKKRKPYFQDRGQRNKVHAYIAGICEHHKCPAYQVGGTADHVHLLCNMHPTIAPSDLMREAKSGSSKWIKASFGGFEDFAWQRGYGTFTIGSDHRHRVMKYIADQEVHHQTVDFKTEFLDLLKYHGVDYDPRFVWD